MDEKGLGPILDRIQTDLKSTAIDRIGELEEKYEELNRIQIPILFTLSGKKTVAGGKFIIHHHEREDGTNIFFDTFSIPSSIILVVSISS